MAVHIGIDTCVFTRNDQDIEDKKFISMIGVAVATEDLEGFEELYKKALKDSFDEIGITINRNILSSNEILSITKGNIGIHENIFRAILPKISKLNIFFPIFNSKRILKIKVYGKKKHTKEISISEFYNRHLINSFPHICLWKIYNYIFGTKAVVYIDHFQSEITEAWEIISKYPKIYCYINGDITNTLISAADILCRLVENRLKEKNLFLRADNLVKIFPELKKNQLFCHWIGNHHLPKITMIHTNKVLLNKYIKRPIFYLYLEKGSKIDKKNYP